jgi:hypothetical protein
MLVLAMCHYSVLHLSPFLDLYTLGSTHETIKPPPVDPPQPKLNHVTTFREDSESCGATKNVSFQLDDGLGLLWGPFDFIKPSICQWPFQVLIGGTYHK